jgi:prephenate dehydrogenase
LDVVVSCVPVPFIAASLAELAPRLRPNAVLTDAGSVKKPVIQAVRKALRGRRGIEFVGAHPMAGSEKTGVANASADLFAGTVCAVTSEGATAGAVRVVEKLWSAAGARPLHLSAAAHDRITALTSHLPHVIAFVLHRLVEDEARRAPAARALTAGSFRDMTRVAAADRVLWQGIFSTNRAETERALALFVRRARALVKRPAPRSPTAPSKRG